MKKAIIVLAAVCFVFASVEAKEKKQKKSKDQAPVVKIFTNDIDSMSYALGMNVGNDFSKNIKKIPGGKSNIDLLIKGFTTAMKGDSTLMSEKVAGEYFRNFITKAQAKESESKKGEGEKFLTENKNKEGVQTTPSGLQYMILVSKDGPKPQATDSVKVHYQGFLLDGTKFDSSVDRGEPIVFPLNQVIPGWTEGVQLMSVGSKYKLFIPYKLAYGEQGMGPIPGFSTLIFEVELLDIIKPKAVEPVKEVKPAVKPTKPEVKRVK